MAPLFNPIPPVARFPISTGVPTAFSDVLSNGQILEQLTATMNLIIADYNDIINIVNEADIPAAFEVVLQARMSEFEAKLTELIEKTSADLQAALTDIDSIREDIINEIKPTLDQLKIDIANALYTDSEGNLTINGEMLVYKRIVTGEKIIAPSALFGEITTGNFTEQGGFEGSGGIIANGDIRSTETMYAKNTVISENMHSYTISAGARITTPYLAATTDIGDAIISGDRLISNISLIANGEARMNELQLIKPLAVEYGGTGTTTGGGTGGSGIVGTVPISQGGTGATTAAAARTNLGLGAVSTASIVQIANGGTGAANVTTARSNLGLENMAMRKQYNGTQVLTIEAGFSVSPSVRITFDTPFTGMPTVTYSLKGQYPNGRSVSANATTSYVDLYAGYFQSVSSPMQITVGWQANGL